MLNNELVEILKNGGIAVVPTDTVYGIVCDALNVEAVKKVYHLKKRDFSKPMIILVSDIDMVNEYVAFLSSLEKDIIKKYWPGPLTIILKKKNISDIVTASLDEIGIRLPDNESLQELIKKIGRPIIATSANISSKETINEIKWLEDSIAKNVDYIYNGGLIENQSSTIIKVINDKIKIIRSGDISKKIIDDYKDNIIM